MVWATSFPASILASPGTPPNSFFSPGPWRFPGPPCLIEEPIVRFDGPFGAIKILRFHPKEKQKCVRSHTVSFRGGSSANQAWQRRPFALTKTAKSYNNRGGWAKSSTAIEVIEPFSFGLSCIAGLPRFWRNVSSQHKGSGPYPVFAWAWRRRLMFRRKARLPTCYLRDR